MSEQMKQRVVIKPSDLYYRYKRKKDVRSEAKFTGKPDKAIFDKDDMYDAIAMLEAVMNSLGSQDAEVLEKTEEIMIKEMPACIQTREDVFDCLYETMSSLLAEIDPERGGTV